MALSPTDTTPARLASWRRSLWWCFLRPRALCFWSQVSTMWRFLQVTYRLIYLFKTKMRYFKSTKPFATLRTLQLFTPAHSFGSLLGALQPRKVPVPQRDVHDDDGRRLHRAQLVLVCRSTGRALEVQRSRNRQSSLVFLFFWGGGWVYFPFFRGWMGGSKRKRKKESNELSVVSFRDFLKKSRSWKT